MVSRNRVNIDSIREGLALNEVTMEDRERAARAVCGGPVRDAKDARLILEMLGLVERIA